MRYRGSKDFVSLNRWLWRGYGVEGSRCFADWCGRDVERCEDFVDGNRSTAWLWCRGEQELRRWEKVSMLSIWCRGKQVLRPPEQLRRRSRPGYFANTLLMDDLVR